MTGGQAGHQAAFYKKGPKKATLETSLVGDNNDILFTSIFGGTLGNSISITYTDPSANDQELAITVTGKSIDVSLATGGAGAITSTATQIKNAINANDDARRFVMAELASGNDGSGVVTAMVQTSLSGGSADMTQAFSNITLADLGDHIHYQPSSIDNRFWDSSQTLTVEKHKCATLDTDLTGDNNDLHFCAKTPGTGGNSVTVKYTDPSASSQPLTISVVTNDIEVLLATDGDGAIISTASEILAAINADGDAYALLKAYLKTGNTGEGVVTDMAKTNLAGGADWTSVSSEDYSVPYYYSAVVVLDAAIEEFDALRASGTQHIVDQVAASYDFSLNMDVEMKECTVFASGGHREYKAGNMSGNATVKEFWVTPGHEGDLKTNLITVYYIYHETGYHRVTADGYLSGYNPSASQGEIVDQSLAWTFTGEFYLEEDLTY